jgi:hypothetical protein
MNYKVMQRPMFRLGGGVVKGKKVGNRENFATIEEIENLINKRAGIRDKALSGMGSMLPFQVLAGQGENIRSIRSLGDVTNILSNLGTDPSTFAALGKLSAIDLKKSEGALTDKITLAKLKASMNKSTDYLRKKEDLALIQIKEDKIKQKVADLDKNSPSYKEDYDSLSREYQKLQERKAQTVSKMQTRADAEADYIKSYRDEVGVSPSQDQIDAAMREKGFLAAGGRVGYQQGTPNPMVMPQPKPQQVMDDRKLNTLMTAAPAMEDPNEARSMGDKDMYGALRRRLPPEITDDVVRLIAYNREAFTDFANISDQSDVESFNQKYNVELVLPVGNQ